MERNVTGILAFFISIISFPSLLYGGRKLKEWRPFYCIFLSKNLCTGAVSPDKEKKIVCWFLWWSCNETLEPLVAFWNDFWWTLRFDDPFTPKFMRTHSCWAPSGSSWKRGALFHNERMRVWNSFLFPLPIQTCPNWFEFSIPHGLPIFARVLPLSPLLYSMGNRYGFQSGFERVGGTGGLNLSSGERRERGEH